MLEKLGNIIKEPIRGIRKRDKLFLNEYWIEFRKFLLFGIAGGILSYFAADFVINICLNDIQIGPGLEGLTTTLKVSISILFAVIVGSIYLPLYIFYWNKTAFSHLFRLRGDGLNPNFRRIILMQYEENINNQLKKLARLTREGEIKADYATQYYLAGLFSDIAQDYFWATSFDKPSEFPIRNINYLEKFNRMALNGVDESNIPKKARVFITTYSDLFQDIAENSQYLLELIKMHMHYSDDKVICSVKFFICANDSFQEVGDLVKSAQLDPKKMIYDFFVIDDEIVYGRKNKKLKRTDRELDISFIGKQKLINSDVPHDVFIYKEVFTKIWNNAYDINSLASNLKALNDESDFSKNSNLAIKNLSEYQIISEEKIKEAIHRFAQDARIEYEKIENTESRNNRYSQLFGNNKTGQEFFNKWEYIIKNASESAWAVDSSERKEGNEFYRIWDNSGTEDYEYRVFFNASAVASKSNCDFRRIFIINNLIPEKDQEIFRIFLYKAVDTNKMKIGIVLNEQSALTDDEKLNYGDFLIVEIKNEGNNSFDFGNAKGFTLRNSKFKVENLSFIENLILDKDFGNYQQIFNKLWDNSNTVRFEQKADLQDSQKINQLIELEKS